MEFIGLSKQIVDDDDIRLASAGLAQGLQTTKEQQKSTVRVSYCAD